MIRAAAKNHAYATVVVDPADYAAVLSALDENGGTTYASAPAARGEGLRAHGRL